MCGVVQAPLLYLATNDNVVSLQMTADFVGSPFYPNNAQVQYQKAMTGRLSFGSLFQCQGWVSGGFAKRVE